MRQSASTIEATFDHLTFFFTKNKALFFLKILVSYSEKAMAPHSCTLAWKIPWTEEPGGLQSMLSVRHD